MEIVIIVGRLYPTQLIHFISFFVSLSCFLIFLFLNFSSPSPLSSAWVRSSFNNHQRRERSIEKSCFEFARRNRNLAYSTISIYYTWEGDRYTHTHMHRRTLYFIRLILVFNVVHLALKELKGRCKLPIVIIRSFRARKD